MEFIEFKVTMQRHVERILENQTSLFVADVSGDELWDLYLDSFPIGTNPIFRERTQHDCSCCRHFVRQFGNVVVISDNRMISIWDFETDSEEYQPVLDALSNLIKSRSVRDVFVTKKKSVGTDKNRELIGKDAQVRTWEHFYVSLPERFISVYHETTAAIAAKYRDTKNVFKRSLDEISLNAIETVLDVIAQNSLYRGIEWRGVLKRFLALHKEYHALPEHVRSLWAWSKSVETGGAIGRIKNHSMGVLLTDISHGVDLNEAVRKYESIVAPHNYKRPKAIFTEKMVRQAQETIEEMGLTNSLGRRHAVLDDITINNIIFANRDAQVAISGSGVFDELLRDATPTNYRFDRVEEIPVEHFVEHVLPRATDVSVFIENRLAPNFFSLIAPKNSESPSLFKWSNGFSWAYAGNITDSSMKERVKAAGGDVGGVLRFSIQWNESGDNQNDFDAHCREPDGDHIYFVNKGRRHKSSGMLDVDIINPGVDVAVENITWQSLSKMGEGEYSLYVHNYAHNGGRSGFSAEVEFDEQIHSYEYNKELRQNEKVPVAKVCLNDGRLEITESLPSSISSKEIWGIQTGQFHQVQVAMFSPNYWDGQSGIGHRHYFFILANCLNTDQPNGFFNEFLQEEFMPHKRVFEALGGKMKVEQAESQLSGIGFSSTKRNSLVIKLEGHTSRVVRVVF